MKTLYFSMYMRFFLACFALSTSVLLQAKESLQWNGFVAQGLIYAEHSNFVNDESDLSMQLTEIGINGSYQLSPNLRLAGQAVYLNGGNRYPEGPRLDYFFFDINGINSLDWQINLHLGRVKNYHWTYSSTRDIPHTRPTIILPQSIYFDNFRDIALGVDGAALVANTSNSLGDWEINWSYGDSPVSKEQTHNLIGRTFAGDLEQDYVNQINLVWQKMAWRMSLGSLKSDFFYNQGADDAFFDGKVQITRGLFQLTYEAEFWQLVSELYREHTIYEDILFPGFLNNSTAEGGYVQGQYFVSSNITLTARIDVYDANRKDRKGILLEQMSAGTTPRYFGFQDTVTVGGSWKFAPQWQVQAEFHRMKGTGRLAPVLQPNTQVNDRKYWNVWGIQLMHWF